MAYSWIKLFHLFSLIAWFAGLFYLPRLYVYHHDLTPQNDVHYNRFLTMERRLFWAIMTPAGILTTLTGHFLLDQAYFYRHTLWMNTKLACVAFVWFYHILCYIYYLNFARYQPPHSAVFFRLFNEIPTLLLAAILVCVVIKPGGF